MPKVTEMTHMLLTVVVLTTLTAAAGGVGKKYTLRIPMVVNLGGFVNPLGDMCTKGLDMLLSRVNNQSQVLPDYSVIVDIYDDQCIDAVAIRQLVPALQNWTDITDLSSTRPSLRISTGNDSLLAYTPPFFVGGICSGSCKQTGKLAQHFNLTELAIGCLDPFMDEKAGYDNFNRLSRSIAEYPDARIEVALSLGWTKVAIICDMVQYMFQDTQNFMRALNRRGLPVISTEFSTGDPTEALSRLKAADARIIFAICYTSTCPAIACAAYKLKYFGPNVVWIFNSEIDLSSQSYRPAGCNASWIDEFQEGSLYIGIDFTAVTIPEHRSEIGISAIEIAGYIRKKSPNALDGLAGQWRLGCFELAHNGIFLADKVERKLQRRGETLMTFAADPGNYDELRQMFITAITSIHINATWGVGSIIQSDSNLTGRSYTAPPFVVQQIQRGVKIEVLAQLNPNTRMKQLSAFVWKTSSGSAPYAEPVKRFVEIGISRNSVVAVKIIAVVFVVAVVVSVVLLLNPKFRQKHGSSFPEMNAVILLGTILPLSAILVYPSDVEEVSFGSMNEFCLATPILVVFGATVSTGGMGVKFWATFLCRVQGSIASFPKIRRQSFLFLFLYSITVFGILAGFYAGDGRPAAVKVVERSELSKDPFPELLYLEKWWTCSSKDFTTGWVVIGVHAAFAVASIILSFMAKGVLTKVFISDLQGLRMCLYVLLTLEIIFVFALSAICNYAVQFAVLATYSFSQAAVTQAFVVIMKLWPEPLEPQPPSRGMGGTLARPSKPAGHSRR